MSEMPQELRERLPHDVALYVANYWRHPDNPERPYDFYNTDGTKYFHYLTDEDGPLNPENWEDIVVLLFARGCLKTTTCTMILNWVMDVYTNVEAVVTAPRREQTQEVMGRFKRAVEESNLDKRYEVNQKTHQQFVAYYYDENGELRKGYNDLKARSAWGEGDALRGIHAHVGVVDEFQDVDEGMFSVFKETVDRSVPNVPYFPVIFVIGTPKMANSFFHQLWEISDKRSWDDESKEWHATQEPQEYLPPDALERKTEIKDKIDELKELDGDHDELIKQLQEEYDNIAGFRVVGWHIDQHACPRHQPTDIAFKEATYSKRKFKNEVLAEFYTPENDLLSDKHVHAAFYDDGFRKRPVYDDSYVYMGVDWGGGDGEGASSTAVWVAEEDAEGVLSVLNFEWLNHDLTTEEEQTKIEEYLIAYEPDICVVDEGHGGKTRSNLQEGNGTLKPGGYDNIYGCHYGHVNNTSGITWSRKGNRAYFTVNRTFMIESMVEDFKNGYIKLPGNDLEFGTRNAIGTRLIRELTAPYTDAVETPDGKRKLKVLSDTHDDAFHALTFLWIAARHVRSKRNVRTVYTNNLKGYDNDI